MFSIIRDRRRRITNVYQIAGLFCCSSPSRSFAPARYQEVYAWLKKYIDEPNGASSSTAR
jgi:hypothetical protein